MENTLTVANTILEQLGGRRFIVMTGASRFVGSETTLTFKLPARSTKDGSDVVRITLTPADVYTLETFHFNPRATSFDKTLEPRTSRDGVYNDVLAQVFESVTGLRVSL
jgi:hypothetical protein